MGHFRSAFVAACLALTSSCLTGDADPRALGDARRVEACIDAFHAAASKADGAGYFALLSDDSIFLGTDATERWTREEFRAYAEPYFSQGRGWTYHPFDRHVSFSDDGSVAWFDERLANEKYGELRGTGVLRRGGGAWRIVHYSMTFPIPNDLTREVVAQIRALGQG